MSQEPGPEVQGAPVTARNWQDPPGQPLGVLARRRDPAHLPRVPRRRPGPRAAPVACRSDRPAATCSRSPVTRADGSAGTVGEVLADTFTDAYVVLQDGELVTEWYGPLGAPDRPHALMSVSKSVVGCVAAVLIDRGQLDPDREITGYVPELAASGYAGALVRHVLDMRSGVRFVEEYANPHADIRRLDEWIGWQPGQGEPRGLYRFLATLQAEAPHGSRFLYRSAESDVLGWVCERAAGRPMAELMSELIWAPMGAEHDAVLLHDGLGTAVHDGGPVRHRPRRGPVRPDAAGRGRGSGREPGARRRVVPPQWLRQAWAVDSDTRAAFAASPAEWAFPGGWYRHQFWFRPGDYGDVLLCLGIHGQMVHVSRRTNTVCVKFSTWPEAQNPAYLEDTLRAFDAVGGFLAGRDPPGRGRRLAGVVSGLSRSGDTAPPSPPPADRDLTGRATPQDHSRRRRDEALTWRYGRFRSSAGSPPRRHLNGIAEIRTFFRTNSQPIYFVGPTAFNLLGIDRWVRNFQYIAYYDSWDGQHPRVFTPENRPYVEFESSEQINNYLLRDAEVREHLRRRGGDADGRDGVLRRRDRGDLPGAGLHADPAAGFAAAPAGLQDRHHPAGQRGGRAVGPERARPSGQLRRAHRARGVRRPRRRTWLCRRPTATRARPPSSSSPNGTGTPTPRTSTASSSR